MTGKSPDPDGPVVLGTYANEIKAGLIRAILGEAGIETRVRTDDAMLGIWGASLGNTKTVMVNPQDLAMAREVLERVREESIDIDWSEVDVGDPEDSIALRVAAGEAASGIDRWNHWFFRTVLPAIAIGLVLLVGALLILALIGLLVSSP